MIGEEVARASSGPAVAGVSPEAIATAFRLGYLICLVLSTWRVRGLSKEL